MQRDRQIEIAHRLFHYMDSRTTACADAPYRNEVVAFTCPDRARAERQKLFRETPLVAGFSCRLREPGDYVAGDLAGQPVLLVRDDDGRVNAFLNVCRHRGARVVEGCGSGQKTFACPYHAWMYDRKGRLAGIADARSFEGVDRETHGLVPLPAAERHGLVFVLPTPDPDGAVGFEVDRFLTPELSAEFAGYGFAGHHHYADRTIRQKMNWKVAVDTFLEGYHIKSLHHASIAPILHSNLSDFRAYGPHHVLVLPRTRFHELRDRPEQDWDVIRYTAMVYLLFPNTLFVVQGDHIETWRIVPDGDDPEHCIVEASLFTPEPAVTDKAKLHWDKNWDLLWKTVITEDFPLGETIQQGFHSGAQTHLVYGRNEPGMINFHKSVRRGLGLAEQPA